MHHLSQRLNRAALPYLQPLPVGQRAAVTQERVHPGTMTVPNADAPLVLVGVLPPERVDRPHMEVPPLTHLKGAQWVWCHSVLRPGHLPIQHLVDSECYGWEVICDPEGGPIDDRPHRVPLPAVTKFHVSENDLVADCRALDPLRFDAIVVIAPDVPGQ